MHQLVNKWNFDNEVTTSYFGDKAAQLCFNTHVNKKDCKLAVQLQCYLQASYICIFTDTYFQIFLLHFMILFPLHIILYSASWWLYIAETRSWLWLSHKLCLDCEFIFFFIYIPRIYILFTVLQTLFVSLYLHFLYFQLVSRPFLSTIFFPYFLHVNISSLIKRGSFLWPCT